MRIVLLFVMAVSASPAEADKCPRLLITTDIGGDPDDQQSLIRLMTYANEFEIEGLIASASGTPGELKERVVKPHLIREIVEAYGQVRDNLAKHAPGYPAAQTLLDRVKAGNPHRGRQAIGEGRDTEASRWIIQVADRPDPRPLNIAIWGGQTDLAQALWRVRNDRSDAELKEFLGRIRVYDIADQDGLQPWIHENFPDLFYVLAKAPEGQDKRNAVFRGMYLGGDESLTSREWIERHIRTDHGPLGAIYPNKTWTAPNPHSALKEGDTPSWFYFLPVGLSDSARPEWGGWGGRFQPAGGGLYRDARDTVGETTDARATVWRWRPAFQADFQARMDWCVQSPGEANHPPIPAVGDDASREVIRVEARPGESITLDASQSTDPDDDQLSYQWFVYPEAGAYAGNASVASDTSAVAQIDVPQDAAGKTLHLVLAVTDDGDPSLTRYRRVVISVSR